MADYFRPLVQLGPARPKAAIQLAGGWGWFEKVELIRRRHPPQIKAACELPAATLQMFTANRPPIAGLTMEMPRLMGILNTTPDSFSDGGEFDSKDAAERQGLRLIREGADILDVGGESTRPGAKFVSPDTEVQRVVPPIKALSGDSGIPISIDTRKAAVARAALAAGAQIINDVSALGYDPQLGEVAASNGCAVCLMHSPGDPETMQNSPHYDDVVLDVYDHLSERINWAVSQGIERSRIMVDPGIGFGKTDAHNIALMQGLSLFHGLGCPIMLGVSRKSMIGRIGDAPDPMARLPGSVALALAGVAQGVQITRVHDIAETKQAFRLWAAATGIGQKT